MAGLEHERRVVGDHPDRQAEEVKHRAHPLRVAAGEVVVDRHDMNAPPGHRVECRGERRQERLALAGLHLGDLSLVEDDATEELNIVLAHPEGPKHRLAAHREDIGQDLVHRGLEAGVLGLATRLGELAATLHLRMMELVVGRFVRNGDLDDLGAQRREPGANLLVGERLDLGLERVGRVDERLDALQFSIIRVDEARQKSQHVRCSLAEVPANRA